MTEKDSNPQQDDVAAVVRAAGRRPTPPAGAYEQVLEVATAAWEQKVSQRRRRVTWSRMAAGVAVVAVSLAVWLGVGGDLSRAPAATVMVTQGDAQWLQGDSWQGLNVNATVAARTNLMTGDTGAIALQLETGVQLRVAADTRLTVLNADTIELLAGRVYVDSDRYSLGGDLRLLTPFGEVRDIGTQFQVDVNDQWLRVRIREGQVFITDTNMRVDGGVGEEIQVDRERNIERIAFPINGPEWGWAEALAKPFAGGSLKDFLVWIARETGYVLEFDDRRTERLAATVKVSGNTAGFTLEEALAAQKPTAPSFDYEIRDGVIRVFRDQSQ